VEKLKPFIRKRIETYQKSEQRFNLMAIVEDKKQSLENEKTLLLSQLSASQSLLGQLQSGSSVSSSSTSLPTDIPSLTVHISNLESRLHNLELNFSDESSKREKWRVENERRRFNYVPFAFAMLKALSSKGKLDELVDRARAKQKDRAASRNATK
jgi:ubiquitin carboxyl-terminal hydrolase L5